METDAVRERYERRETAVENNRYNPLNASVGQRIHLVCEYEGSPNIVKEALACNTPVYSVNAGDVAQMLDGVSNSAVVGRTPEAIAAMLLQLLRVPCRSNGREKMFRYSAKAKFGTRISRACKGIW